MRAARGRRCPAGDSGRTTRLPDELLEEQVYRLTLLTAVIAGLWTLGLFVDIVLAPLVWGVTEVSRQGITVELVGLRHVCLHVRVRPLQRRHAAAEDGCGPGVPGAGTRWASRC